MTTYTADSLPPCPECGGQLSDESGIDDDGPYFAYDCPVCSWHWGENGETEPLAVATAPWTRDLWAEVERAREERDRQAAHARSLSEALDNTIKDRDDARMECTWAHQRAAQLARRLEIALEGRPQPAGHTWEDGEIGPPPAPGSLLDRVLVTLVNASADGERVQQERDQLRATLAEVLDCLTEHGHPGKDCQRTGWVVVETVTRWRELLSPSGREEQADNEEEGER